MRGSRGRVLAVVVGAGLLSVVVAACAAHARGLPPGPPPEYEQPPLGAWDAGAPRTAPLTPRAADGGAPAPGAK